MAAHLLESLAKTKGRGRGESSSLSTQSSDSPGSPETLHFSSEDRGLCSGCQ